jgi:hypothetical protein
MLTSLPMYLKPGQAFQKETDTFVTPYRNLYATPEAMQVMSRPAGDTERDRMFQTGRLWDQVMSSMLVPQGQPVQPGYIPYNEQPYVTLNPPMQGSDIAYMPDEYNYGALYSVPIDPMALQAKMQQLYTPSQNLQQNRERVQPLRAKK